MEFSVKMNKKNNFFGSNIKWWRKKNKISQTNFAKLIKKKTSSISSYENGISTPSLGVITHISLIMGYSVDEIMYEDLSKRTDVFNDNLIDSLNDNPNSENTLKLKNESIPEAKDLKMLISTEQFRIQEVKNLIKVLAENYKLNNDEKIIYRTFNTRAKQFKNIDLDDYNYDECDISDLKKREEKLHALLFAVYEDLFNITSVYNIIMAK